MSLSFGLALTGTDLSTVAILLAILWLDGWRSTPVDGVVVRRVLLMPWRVYLPTARIGGFAFLAWWPPLVVPLVLRAPTALVAARWNFDVALARARRRRRRLALHLGVVRLVGALLVVWIALAIPILTAYAGAHGLLRGITTAFVISAAVTSITVLALRHLCLSWRDAWRRALPLLSPFSTSRAPEFLLEAAFADVDPAAAMRALLDDRAFRSWLRPAAFDALARSRTDERNAGAPPPSVIASFAAQLPRSMLQDAITAPGDGTANGQEAERYCARCGRTFLRTTSTCVDCGGLALSDYL